MTTTIEVNAGSKAESEGFERVYGVIAGDAQRVEVQIQLGPEAAI